MKFFHTLFVVMAPVFLCGQITIDQSDMPNPGDTIRKSQAVNIGSIDFEATGPGSVWDFTSLQPFLQTVDTFVAVNETPYIYQIFFFLSANLARKQAEFNQFQGFQLTDSYSFFKNSSSSFKEVGFGVTMNGIPLPTLYDDPDVIYQFPVETGNVDSSFSSYAFDIPGIGYLGGWKKRKNTVDGWGTVSTPFGSFETLRLKSEIVQFDSLYIDSLGFGFPIFLELTEYKWLGNGKGVPLCEVVDNGLVQTVSYIDSLRNVFTGPVPDIPETGIWLAPNPAREWVSVSMGGEPGQTYHLEIFNMMGSAVVSMEGITSGGALLIDLSGYQMTKGTYILFLRTDLKVFTEKLWVF